MDHCSHKFSGMSIQRLQSSFDNTLFAVVIHHHLKTNELFAISLLIIIITVKLTFHKASLL